MSPLSPQQIEDRDHRDAQIADEYLKGDHVETIAERHGVSTGPVYKALKRTGTTMRPQGRRGPQPLTEWEKGIVLDYQSGVSIPEIVSAHGVKRDRIYSLLRRAGEVVTRRAPSRTFTDDEIEAAVERWENGEFIREIAESIGTTYWVLGAELQRRGIKRGNNGGSAHGMWKGGRTKDGAGYVLIKVFPDDPMYVMASKAGYVREHRLVMARHLGRPLTRSESVHHTDGVRDHNDIENLQLRQGQHGRGVAMRCCDCGSTNIESMDLP